ncbi:MAG: ABC transporter permease [Gammaproteobacteria bacterium]
MMRLIAHRLLQMALVLFFMSIAIYALIGLMPGDPIDMMISADPHITSADMARLKALYGMDRPLAERWWHWLAALAQGNFGYSRLYAAPVLTTIGPALADTVQLMGISLLLSLLIALPAGVFAALRPYSLRDHAINIGAYAGISLPAFWLALMLIILFSVKLGILPASGVASTDAQTLWDQCKYLVLPVATLTLARTGAYTRFMRGSMLEVMRQDYIRTARAKGAGTARIVVKHALRNALIPVVTILALDFGSLFSGALITETVFGWPGMGKLIYDAILGNDFNLALVALLLATFVTLAGSLLADLAYAWLDPRIIYR